MAQNRLYGEEIYGDGLYGLDVDNSTLLNVQNSSLNGLDIIFSNAAANGNYFYNTSVKNVYLYVKNASGGDIVMTIYNNTRCNYNHYHNFEVTIGAGEETIIGSFCCNRDRYNTRENKVYLWYDGVASLTIAAINIEN